MVKKKPADLKELTKNEKWLYNEVIKKNSTLTIDYISEKLKIPKEEIFPLVDKLRSNGFDVITENGKVFLRSEPIGRRIVSVPLPPITKNTIKILLLSDICLGLKKQQGDLLATAYNIAEKEEVFFAVIAGNLIAGKPKKGKVNEYFLSDPEEQAQYAINVFPKAPFKTYYINGPNEINCPGIGEIIAEKRDDIKHCGDWETILGIGKKGSKVAILHDIESQPYTKSYALQGIMENYQEAETYVFEGSEPLKLICVGGLGTFNHIPRRLSFKKELINNFDGIAIPSLHRITSTERTRRKRGGSPVLGCVIVTLDFDNDGNLTKIITDFRNLTSYHKDNDYLEEINSADNFNDEQSNTLSLFKHNYILRKGEIARKIGKSVSEVEKIIEEINVKGFKIIFNDAQKAYMLIRNQRNKFKALDLKKMYVKRAKVGVISDTHIGHEDHRMDLITASYENAKERKVDHMLHCGDGFEGEGAHKGHERELIILGADKQRDFALENWPKIPIPTTFISGSGTSHAQSYLDKSGHDITDTFVRLLRAEKGLKNYYYLGGEEGVVEVNGIKFGLKHPTGGIPYGISYRPQKFIETLVANMKLDSDAKILLLGHLHIATCLFYKGMAGFLVPCLEDNTKYISSKGYIPWLGMWVCEFFADGLNNITRIVSEYIPYEPKIKNIVKVK